MSGYLRRLAAAAMHPPRAIHAVVGAVYAPHRPAAAPALQEVSESREAASDAAAPTQGQVGRAGRGFEGFPHPSAFEADTSEAVFTPLIVERERELRGLSLRGAEPHESDAGRTAETGRERRAEWLPRSAERVPEVPVRLRKQVEATESGPVEYHVVEEPARADAESSGEPQLLIATQRISAESSSPQPIPASIRPQSAGVPRPTGPQARAERAEEPDEIQIHIGRIEVTAVPPPVAARPAVRPERRSVNLDDYLKQRRGGNR